MFTRSDLSSDGSINTQEEREALNDEVFKHFKRFEPSEGETLTTISFNCLSFCLPVQKYNWGKSIIVVFMLCCVFMFFSQMMWVASHHSYTD